MVLNKLGTWTVVIGVALGMTALVQAQVTKKDAPTITAAAQAKSSSTKPAAKVDNVKHDFGDVWINEKLEHTFKITNTGDAVLDIVKVKPACGCTKAGPHPSNIKPGDTGSFSFKLNTKNLKGRFTKAITITTNDEANKSMRLSLTGNVRHFVNVEPNVAQFSRVKADTVETKTLKLTNNTDERLTLTVDPSSKSKSFDAEISEIVPGKQFELKVTAHPPFNEGINRFPLKLRTNVSKQTVIDVICMATLPKRLELRPTKILISDSAKTETIRRVVFNNNGETPIKVLSATATDPKITVESRELQEGRNYQFTVKIPAGYKPASTDTALVLQTDDPKDPKILVPISTPKQAPKPRKRPAEEMLNKIAPEFAGKTSDGKDLKIGGKQDEVQVLAFYASWCGFCKRALPKVEDLHKKLASENIKAKVIAVNLDDRGKGRRARTEEQSLDHFKKMGLTMPLLLDSKKQVGSPFKVTSFPTMFIVDQNGKVVEVVVGARKGFENTLETKVKQLVKGKTVSNAGAQQGAAVSTVTATLPRK